MVLLPVLQPLLRLLLLLLQSSPKLTAAAAVALQGQRASAAEALR